MLTAGHRQVPLHYIGSKIKFISWSSANITSTTNSITCWSHFSANLKEKKYTYVNVYHTTVHNIKQKHITDALDKMKRSPKGRGIFPRVNHHFMDGLLSLLTWRPLEEVRAASVRWWETFAWQSLLFRKIFCLAACFACAPTLGSRGRC